MSGQVLGGGVIVLVAVLLWLVYLLPTWHSRYRYDTAERNAVRLNQALRVLAETSETPEEVRLELSARTALAQQRLARRAQAEREEAARKAQAQLDAEARKAQSERALLEQRTQRERQQAELEQARRDLAAARALPEARRARARRRARAIVAALALVALALVGAGAWLVVATGAPFVLASGVVVALICAWTLVRLARRRRPAAVAAATPAVRAEPDVQDVALGSDRRAWAPRTLPRPLTASTGSQAAAVLDGAEAREALRQAAAEEAMRERAERRRPASIERARAARAVTAQSDDAAIEAHVRELLRQRAAG